MYRVNKDVALEDLRKYGFKPAREYPDNENFICNSSEKDDYWLISMDPDDTEEIYYADDNREQPVWSVHILQDRRMWIECVSSVTHYTGGCELEHMLFVFRNMILDGMIEDDFEQ